MHEGFEIVETAEAEAHPHVPPPVLVILPDPEATFDVLCPVLGRPLIDRLARAALDAGFGGVLMGAGTRAEPPGAQELATGEPIERPALVVYEGSGVHPELLRLMVAHPLEPGERYTLYDEAGRPTAVFSGGLRHMPSSLAITEELPWPDGMGPSDVVRLVYEEDLARAENLVLLGDRVGLPGRSAWHRRITLPILRRLSNSRRPLAQIELLALAVALLALPLVLGGGAAGLPLGAFAMLVGVQVGLHMKALRELRGPRTDSVALAPGERVARATRPLSHAAMMVALTYVLVAQTHRSTVAAVVLLAAGGAAALLSLVQARLILRDRPADVFAMPQLDMLAQRLSVTMPRWVEGAPLVELTVLLVAIPGYAALPWSVLATVAVARLWRWYVGPGLLDGEASAR
ncbi:hypothetical protein [Paraliomyxa miuraensis]|uniref:hypothetical protein n=1 Tax=Paraliomyxa miuraensis TaxID=376150 RepID=UPI00224E7C67|nr:hypothetical protein [Paraliomyxa miuraensis]MCX4241444.1 hypothetical protein [Paraliomyxa miuraensis]